jgi:hypothetical protein
MKQKKFASSEAKRMVDELEKNWDRIQSQKSNVQQHVPRAVVKRSLKRKPVMVSNPRVAEMRAIQSLDTGITGAVNCGTEAKVYTGDKIIGIATMHKSNLVPIFSDADAKAVASMRR